MLKKVAQLLAISMLCSSAYVYAGSGFYVGGHIGAAGVEAKDTDTYSRVRVNGEPVPGLPDAPGTAPYGNNTDWGFAGGVSAGYDFTEKYDTPVRVELNYTARSTASSSKDREHRSGSKSYMNLKQDIDLQTLMLNMWADIPTNTKLKPYVGGGIGMAFIDYDVTRTDVGHPLGSAYDGKMYSGSVSKTNFAWSLGAGVAYDVTPNFTLDLGYRYINAGDIKTTNQHKLELWQVEGDKTGKVYGANEQTVRTKVRSNELFLGGRVKF